MRSARSCCLNLLEVGWECVSYGEMDELFKSPNLPIPPMLEVFQEPHLESDLSCPIFVLASLPRDCCKWIYSRLRVPKLYRRECAIVPKEKKRREG